MHILARYAVVIVLNSVTTLYTAGNWIMFASALPATYMGEIKNADPEASFMVLVHSFAQSAIRQFNAGAFCFAAKLAVPNSRQNLYHVVHFYGVI